MENLHIKEKRLETALEKLKNLNSSYSGGQNEVNDLYVEKNQLQSEKTEIERKYKQLLTEYNNLKKRLDEIQEENSKKQKLQDQFNQDIDELGRETDSFKSNHLNTSNNNDGKKKTLYAFASGSLVYYFN